MIVILAKERARVLLLLSDLQKIVTDNKEGLVDSFTLSVEQAKQLISMHNALNDKNKERFLAQTPFQLLSFFTVNDVVIKS